MNQSSEMNRDIRTGMFGALLLIRPYSIVGLFLLYFVAKVIATKSIALDYKTFLLFTPVLLSWAFLTFLLEAEHKHSNRKQVSHVYSAVSILVAIILGIAWTKAESIIFAIVLAIFTVLYIKKNSVKVLGNLSFISRGFMELSIFFYSASLYVGGEILNNSFTVFGLIVLLITSVRSLLGDIRDTKFDSFTFSKTFGYGISYQISIMLYTLAAIFLYAATNSLEVIFPIIAIVVTLLFIDSGRIFHRLAVILSSFVMANYILFLANAPSIIIVDILFICILSNLVFYDAVPRESNPKEITSTRYGFIPWATPNKEWTGQDKDAKNN